MHSPKKLRRHAALLDDMATKTGLDLQEQVMSGRLSMDQLADAVLCCVDCACPSGCVDWLTSGAATPPDFCRNRTTLLELADG